MTQITEASGTVGLSFNGAAPDVLTCIANLSNDEVFTTPQIANQMLDTVATAWAQANDGAVIWADSSVTFLDPFAKSGVFLREITKRLIDGLAEEIPDLQMRVDHILTRQVFGIGVTQLTALLARRSLYCSKFANGKHSVASAFGEGDGYGNADGHIWFERLEHTWLGGSGWVVTADADGNRIRKLTNGRCKYCGAPQSTLDRGTEAESHAYAFIHTDDIKARVADLFGADMQFDVVIGNPPYQLQSDGGTRDVPIYQKFVDQAKTLEPRMLVMVTPSRWMAGGLGLDDFRRRMLNDRHLRVLVDYSRMESVFPGVDFEGGVSYFLWDRDQPGDCTVSYHLGEEAPVTVQRDLGEFDVFVRDPLALGVLKKVLASGDASITEIMATNNEFALGTNFRAFNDQRSNTHDVALHVIRDGKRTVGWMRRVDLPKGHAFVDRWKVLIPKSYGERGTYPAQILGPILIAEPPSASTQTYVFISANSESEALSIASYTQTRFFRFMLSLRKITQHAAKPVYTWVPQQTWDREWTDEALFAKYGLDDAEVALVEKMIRPPVTKDGGVDA